MAKRLLRAVVANGFDGAAFLGFLASRLFVRIFGLLVNERIAAVVVSLEIVGGSFAAEIAVNALIVHVVFAGRVFGIFICNVSHKIILSWPEYGDGTGQWQASKFSVKKVSGFEIFS